MPITVNEQAPVVVKGEAAVSADAVTVWDILTAIERWPNWNPDVKNATIRGAVAPQTEFRWKAGPGTIVSVFREVEQPRFLAWTGKTMGIRAIHIWRLEPFEGGTLVRTEESWEGSVVRLFRGTMLQSSVDAGLQHLKHEAERRSAS